MLDGMITILKIISETVLNLKKMVHGLFVIVGETEPVHIIIRVISGCHMKRFLYPIRLGCLIFLLMMDMITIIRLMED